MGYSVKDRENNILKKLINRVFFGVERRAADVIEVITNLEIKYVESEEAVDVYQAIKEMRAESEL